MSDVSPTQVSPGDQVTAASVNTPVNQLAAVVNDLDNDNIATGAGISGSKLADNSVDGDKLLTNSVDPDKLANIDGWIVATDTWVYVSATSFKITGVDRTANFPKGTKIKLTQTTAKYFYVTSTSFSTDTTVNVTGGSDYSLANASITSPYYSYSSCPQGHPTRFNWSPTLVGFSANPTNTTYNFSIEGDRCMMHVHQGTNGTSNATNFTITLPVTAVTESNLTHFVRIYSIDNGSLSTTVDLAQISSAGSTVVLNKNDSSTGWTSSGGKRARFEMWYRI